MALPVAFTSTSAKPVDCPEGAVRVSGTDFCTHGPDPLPPGVTATERVAPLPKRQTRRVQTEAICDGDGTSGYRVQVLYIRASDQTSRYAQYHDSFIAWANGVDATLNRSAHETSGERHVRFVTDGNCTPTVIEETVSRSALGTLSAEIRELQAKGYSRSDRIYLMFVDKAQSYLGIGTMDSDDRPGQDNANNTGPAYAQSNSNGWGSGNAIHELTHTWGGVQNSAPNSSGGHHCTDENDILCYSDSPNYPTMRSICTQQYSNYDCNHDDYFNINPRSGSYLDTHWNVARSRFLTGGANPPPTTETPVPPTGPGTARGSGHLPRPDAAGD